MRIPASWALTIVVFVAGAAPPLAAADLSLNYTLDRRVFRVCNLLLPGSTSPTDPGFTNQNPFFFIALDHCALKPPGWEFQNPLASPYVTSAMASAWLLATHSPSGGSGLTYWSTRLPSPYDTSPVGFPINKSWPQHWEVAFTPANAARLRDYDLLYVSATDLNLATPAVRRALMDIVRGGATLWVDSGGPAYTTVVTDFAPPNVPAPIPFTFTPVAPSGTFYRGISDTLNVSDLLLTPMLLTRGEIQALGATPNATTACDGTYVGTSSPPPPDWPLVPILSTFDNSASPPTYTTAVLAGQYGAGRIIVSAIGIGLDAQAWFAAGSRSPDSYQAPDVKFAYNALAWGTQWDASRQASTNTAFSTTSCLPPLDLVWQYPGPAGAMLGPVLASPVISHGRVYAVSLISMVPPGGEATPAMLLCFNATPSTGPGSGPTYTLLWSAALNSLVSNTPGGDTLTDATPHWAGLTAVDMPGSGIPAILLSCVSRAGSVTNGYVLCVNAATGAAIWCFRATPWPKTPPASPAVVRDISTPVVHNGWVYFLCSEFDTDLDGVPTTFSEDDTYGRAWCIDLATGGTAATWVYPDPSIVYPDPSDPSILLPAEKQHILPPFAEPTWVAALPGAADPSGGPRQVPLDLPMIPIVTPGSRNANDVYTDVVLTVGTPVSQAFDGTLVRLNRANLGAAFDPSGAANARRGGLDFALIPTPPGLNANYFRIALQHNPFQTPTPPNPTPIVYRADDESIICLTATVIQDPDDPTGVRNLVVVPVSEARKLFRVSTAAPPVNGIKDPLALPGGVRVKVTYTYKDQPTDPEAVADKEPAMLRGLKPWSVQYGDGERRVTNAAVRGDRLFAATNTPDPGLGSGTVPSGVTGHLVMEDLRDANRGARFDPLSEAPAGFFATRARCEAPPALGHGTAVAAPFLLNATTLMPTLTALATDLQLRVSLGSYPRAPALALPFGYGISRGGAPAVSLLAGGAVIANWQYQIGLTDAGLSFNWESAGNIVAGGASAGHIYGEPILVSWTSDNGTPDNPSDDVALGPELYVVPPLARFDHTSAFLTPNAVNPALSDVNGVLKLNHYPVEMTSVAITTADGMPIVGWTAAEPPISAPNAYTDPTTDPSTPYPSLIPHGWINVTTAVLDLDGDGVADPTEPSIPVGITLQVSYRGFDNDFGFFNVGNPLGGYTNPPWAPVYPPELHQAPILFGASASGVAMAGSAVHIGTEGYAYRDLNADGNNDFEAPGGDINETFLSLLWDPATNFTRAFTAVVANRGIFGAAGSVVTATGMPAVTANGIFTGSRVMANATIGNEIGFVSRLRTRETVIVDAGRVLRCVGQEPVSELTGTQSWERGQATTDRPTPLPLNHPSKVTVLQNGNLLIVDTGNNRVVETDPAGNVVWPLGPAGFIDYGIDPALHLVRPTDAERYYNTYDIDGDGIPDIVTNTVIADGGNNRVIHVRTWWVWAAPGRWEQFDTVQVVTPPVLSDPGNPARHVLAHYTQVEVLTNPVDGTLVGYLCGAPNVNQLVVRGLVGGVLTTNPPAAAPMPGSGALTWGIWSWLYTNPTSGAYDPLCFLGLRNLSLHYYNNVASLDVCCLQYEGRYSVWTATTPAQPFYVQQTLADPGAGVFEWQVSYGATPGLIAATPGGVTNGDYPIWRFTQVEYNAAPWFNFVLPAGTYYKRFLPTSCEALPNGNHLVSNFTGVVERFSKAALAATGHVTSSEVFEIVTTGGTDPTLYTYTVPYGRCIPDPYGPDWPDPLIAPVYAERVMY
jgi:hypothetical protein